MPIEGIAQPETLAVSDAVRLRRYDGRHGFALPWYQDPETVRLVDGDERIYTEELLERMYAWQDGHGELYWIEVQTLTTLKNKIATFFLLLKWGLVM